MSAWLELAPIDGRENDDGRVLWNEDLLLAALVLHGQDAILAHADHVGDVGVGHLAGGPQVPVVVAFPSAAHVLGEDVDLQGDERAVSLADRRGADELAAGDIGEAPLRDPHDHEVVRELDGHILAISGFYQQILAVDLFHRPPDSHGRVRRSLGDRGGGDGGNEQRGDGTNHRYLRSEWRRRIIHRASGSYSVNPLSALGYRRARVGIMRRSTLSLRMK